MAIRKINLTTEEIRHLAELKRKMDAGIQPYVIIDNMRMAVSQKIMQELELKNGQTINLLIHIHIIQLALAENIASMAIKKAMEQSKYPQQKN